MVRDEELARRLVVRRGATGHCTYDEVAKRELIELCRSGVASVAKVALAYGVNPNQLHNWMALHRNGCADRSVARLQEDRRHQPSVFVPVISAPVAPMPQDIKIDITLANGIRADIRCLTRDDLLVLLPALASLPCSASLRS
jgi:transposase